jgi:O-antigen biosynthesis protein
MAEPAPGPLAALDGAGSPHARGVLVIDARFPTPDRDSASMRITNIMALLREVAETVCFVPDDATRHRSSAARLRDAGIRVPDGGSPAEHLRRHGGDYRVVVLSRVDTAVKYLSLVREHAPAARVVFDTTDLASVRGLRGAKVTGNRGLLGQALAAKRNEQTVTTGADCTLVVSLEEKAALAAECPAARIHVLSEVHAMPEWPRPAAARRDLVFVGAFPHHPNADAMEYFLRDVHPRLSARLPGVRTLIVGTEPPDWLARRASADVVVAGHVPDLAALLDRCRVSIAPLRYGAGVKGKVVLSMSYGVPVVGSTVAAEGIGARDGAEMLIADAPDEFVAKVARAYEDGELWRSLAANGRALVERRFSLQAGRRSIRELFAILGVAPTERPNE